MAIKETLELIGSDVVIKQLNDVQKAGEQTLATFNKPLPELKFPEPDTKPTGELTDHVLKLKDALHILRPILQAAGVQVGEFGAFARLASGSIIGLGGALAGAVIVGLAKLEESIATTKGRLTDLFGTVAAGERAFNQLKQGSEGLGTDVEKLAPALESAKTAVDRFVASSSKVKFVALPGVDLPAGTAQNLKSIGDAVLNFFKLLRAGRLDADEAAKADKAFFDTLKEGGLVTATALKNLPTGTVQLLAEAMGRGKIAAEQFIAEVALAPIEVNKLIQALARFGPQAQQAFDQKAVKGVGDALSELLKTLQEGFRTVTGTGFGDFVVGEINAISKGVRDSVQELQDFKKILDEIGATAAFKKVLADAERSAQVLKQLTPAAKPLGPEFTEAFGFVPPPAQKEQLNQQFEELGKEGSASFGKGFRSAPSFFQAQDVKDFIGQDVIAQAEQVGAEAGANIVAGFQTTIPQNLTLFQALYEQIKQLFAQPIPVNFQSSFQGFGGQAAGAPFASGGMVHGPGTGTSDSIFAWLSNREFVVNAKATAAYLPLLHAINSMRLPLSFNMGGMARMMGNRFAGGGAVSSAGNRSLTLVLDQKRFNVTGSKGTIDDLEREASLRGLAMIGKAPSWIR